MSKRFATLIGCSAIVLWATLLALLRLASSQLQPAVAICIIYSLAALLLLALFKWPKLKNFSKTYLYTATLLFVAYELCLSFSISLAQSNQQAIEISIINYLWPSLTVFLLLLCKEQRLHWLFIPGLFLSLCGVVSVQMGDSFHHSKHFLIHLQQNPVSYVLAFCGAIIWAAYCVLTKKQGNGQNAIVLFFCATAITLWLNLLISGQFQIATLGASDIGYLGLAATAFALGYAAWNIGILHGNLNILVILSYFTPVISSLFAMLLLNVTLGLSFWSGTAMVTLGSLLCWYATQRAAPA
ncbi:aromatic amino acid DMT transporter YddG [Acinetobacter larvae]|uniref:EamA family transporter n=1 Tax=Acinetobacter larvae TaxID=1789224 RepID=A0A1B2LW31_9GAMM|nr:aromatic amino acid DMT transporter YddG [Acinetobacter larvae]AOA57156.1 EamA family transporter [Acinetobacter larvae]